MLPARDRIAYTVLFHPWHNCMIAVCFTTPAILYNLKWNWNLLYVVGILENQCSTLKEDGSIQTLVPSRKGVACERIPRIECGGFYEVARVGRVPTESCWYA